MEQEPNRVEIKIEPIDYSNVWVAIYRKRPWWKFWAKELEPIIDTSGQEAHWKPPFDIVSVPAPPPETEQERNERMLTAIWDWIKSRPDY